MRNELFSLLLHCCRAHGNALNFIWVLILKFFFASLQLDDAALQVYKDGDFGAYLDLESSLAEQAEEIEGINSRWVFIILLKMIWVENRQKNNYTVYMFDFFILFFSRNIFAS